MTTASQPEQKDYVYFSFLSILVVLVIGFAFVRMKKYTRAQNNQSMVQVELDTIHATTPPTTTCTNLETTL
jgi:uncharacterized membrane-anchored protein YhcB (DUF1043 family)